MAYNRGNRYIDSEAEQRYDQYIDESDYYSIMQDDDIPFRDIHIRP